MDHAMTMWAGRADELAGDIARGEALLKQLPQTVRDLFQGRLGLSILPLRDRLDSLRGCAALGLTAAHWRDLDTLSAEVRVALLAQLELLGGLPGQESLDAPVCVRAEKWLNKLREQLGLDGRLVVIPGRGPLFAAPLGVVRIPFLDWDLLGLPLLVRALGLLAAEEGSPYRPALAQAGPALSAAPLARDQLFADIFAAVVLGPAYGLALFALELDYFEPGRGGLVDPDLIEERDKAPRPLAAPVERAAAVIIALEAFEAALSEHEQEDARYDKVVEKLRQIWAAAIESAGQADHLDTTLARLRPELTPVVAALLAALSIPRSRIAAAWAEARPWYRLIATGADEGDLPPPTLEALLGCVCLCSLERPDAADDLFAMLEGLDAGLSARPVGGQQRSLAYAVVSLRLRRLERRADHLVQLLRSADVNQVNQRAVIGRFYQLVSQQDYLCEAARLQLRRAPPRPGSWSNLARIEQADRPLRREAVEFFGGLYIRDKKLDRQMTTPPGPSLGRLADRLMRYYSTTTGIAWDAQIIPGANPFLALETEIIRLRFPDWSLFNLPLLGHEFGHLAARATRAFLDFQQAMGSRELHGRPPGVEPAAFAQARVRHVEELWADLFALYTLGPAFACCAIISSFSPPAAYAWYATHPSHHERVWVILDGLDEMCRHAADGEQPFRAVGGWLRQHWEAAVASAAPPAVPGLDARLEQSRAWGRSLLALIDRHYRCGSRYLPEDWEFAGSVANHLSQLPVELALAELDAEARQSGLGRLGLNDLMNGLWIARRRSPESIDILGARANEFGCALLKEER